jgi:hypothetical protein
MEAITRQSELATKCAVTRYYTLGLVDLICPMHLVKLLNEENSQDNGRDEMRRGMDVGSIKSLLTL